MKSAYSPGSDATTHTHKPYWEHEPNQPSVLTLLHTEAQHDSSDYIFSISKTFFILTKNVMGEIVFALGKKTINDSIHNWKKKK